MFSCFFPYSGPALIYSNFKDISLVVPVTILSASFCTVSISRFSKLSAVILNDLTIFQD